MQATVKGIQILTVLPGRNYTRITLYDGLTDVRTVLKNLIDDGNGSLKPNPLVAMFLRNHGKKVDIEFRAGEGQKGLYLSPVNIIESKA
jgi:hypothetical protein